MSVTVKIDKTPPAHRKAAITASVGDLVEQCRTLAPECGVVVCHSVVYELASEPLRRAGG